MRWLPQLISALMTVESGGDPHAVGDHGRALGCLQIHAEVVADVNRLCGTRFAQGDALNPYISIAICALYLEYWADRDPTPVTPEKLARIWNGGPHGPDKTETETYWLKVRAALAEAAYAAEGL